MAKLILVAFAFCGLWISKLSCDFVPARMCSPEKRSEAPRSQGQSDAHASIGAFSTSLAILGMASMASARTSRSRRVVGLRAEAETEAKASEESSEDDEEMANEDTEGGDEEAEDDGEEEEEKPAKWKCLDCGSMNFAAATECDKCGAVKPSATEAKLVDERDQAKAEVAKVMDGFLRMQADLQNYRRDHDQAMGRAKDLGKLDALKKLLPFNEDMATALVEPEGMDEKDKAIHNSYSLLFRKVGDVWAKGGIESLTASVGEKFDDMNHVVVEERESGGEPGTILEVLKSGYKCDGRVVLPVEVVVVASDEAAKDGGDGEGDEKSEEPEEASEETASA